MSKHICHAIGCNTPVAPKLLMCGKHWAMVPKHLQQRVWGTYRKGQEKDKLPAREWVYAARAAIAAVNESERQPHENPR